MSFLKDYTKCLSAVVAFFIVSTLRFIQLIKRALNHIPLWRWLNKPVSESCAPIVRWWNSKAEIARRDNKRYFVSSRKRWGVFGYGRYTDFQPIVMVDEYNVEIEELQQHRIHKEPLFFIGSRSAIMEYVKGMSNSSFDNAISMDEYRAARLTAHIDTLLSNIHNAQSLFRHWLATQVSRGIITCIDGYVLTGPDKNCEVGNFIYKYFDSFETAAEVNLHSGYRSVDHLAKYLLTEIHKADFGLRPPFMFENINERMRDHTTYSQPILNNIVDLSDDSAVDRAIESRRHLFKAEAIARASGEVTIASQIHKLNSEEADGSLLNIKNAIRAAATPNKPNGKSVIEGDRDLSSTSHLLEEDVVDWATADELLALSGGVKKSSNVNLS